MAASFLSCLAAALAGAMDGMPAGAMVLLDADFHPVSHPGVHGMKFFAGGKTGVLGDAENQGYPGSWTVYDFQGREEEVFMPFGGPVRQDAEGAWLYWTSRTISYQPRQFPRYEYYNSLEGIQDLAVLPGGQLLIPGYFESQPEANDYLPRLGRLNASLGGPGVSWTSAQTLPVPMPEMDLKLYPLADGSYLVYDAKGSAYDLPAVRRVLANGEVQRFFGANIFGRIRQIWQQADGRILLSGVFTVEAGTEVIEGLNLIRVHGDGSFDPDFQSIRFSSVRSFALQADGGILVAVERPQEGEIYRLLNTGTVDPAFQPFRPQKYVHVALAPDGRLFAFGPVGNWGGGIEEQIPSSILRLHNGLTVERLTVTANTIRWMRGATAPEINWAEFELANADGSWTSIGMGQRIPGGWELTAALPAAGKIRAGSYHHTPLVDEEFRQEARFGPPQLPAWKLEHLGDTAAPDLGNPDGDALPNLVEYALATDPKTANEPFRLQPEPGKPMCLVFHRMAGHFDVDLIVEAASDPAGPWETLARSLNGGPMQGHGFTHEAELDPDTGEYQCYVCDSPENTMAGRRFYRVRVEKR